LFVNVSIPCEKPAEQQCILSIYDFKVPGSEGVLIDPEMTIPGVEGLLMGTPFFAGATEMENIPFIVTTGDANIILGLSNGIGRYVLPGFTGKTG